jgi:hypothetical protein
MKSFLIIAIFWNAFEKKLILYSLHAVLYCVVYIIIVIRTYTKHAIMCSVDKEPHFLEPCLSYIFQRLQSFKKHMAQILLLLSDLADDQNLAACEAALQRLLAAWVNLKGVLRGVAEAEKLTQKRQKQQEEQEAAKMCPAKSRLETAVRALKEKLQRSRHLAAQQAVTRSLGDVEEVIEAGDPAEIGDLHKQLQEQHEALTATAVQLGDEQLNAITELQITVDKSLRRLNRKRRELVRGTNAGSLFSPAPSEEGGDGGGDNVLPIRFVLPSAEEQNVTTAEAGLSSSQLQQLLTTLAGGARSKLPPPSWPKFNDSYRSFFAFKDELEAFIKDYGQGTSDRTLAQQIKNNCLSKSSAAYVEWAYSPAAILETLGGLFGHPLQAGGELTGACEEAEADPDGRLPGLAGLLQCHQEHSARDQEAEPDAALQHGGQH